MALLLWLLERRKQLADGRRLRFYLSGYLLCWQLVGFIKPTAALPGPGFTAIHGACVAGLR